MPAVCGIVAVVRRRVGGRPLSRGPVLGLIDEGLDRFDRFRRSRAIRRGLGFNGLDSLAADLAAVAERLRSADRLLRGVRGLRLMLGSPDIAEEMRCRVMAWSAVADALERRLGSSVEATPAQLERINRELVGVRDSLWAIGRDRIGAAEGVTALLGGAALAGTRPPGAVEAMLSVHQALSSLDRLEVRGRDSAGLHLLVRDPAFDPGDPAVMSEIERRSRDRDFASGSVRLADGVLSVVYKTAVEIGELGCNTAALRAEMAGDELLAKALDGERPTAQVLGHTRWASVGIISEPNAHPLNSDLAGSDGEGPGSGAGGPARAAPYVVGAVNGDIDNYTELLAAEGVMIPLAITTDSKTLPVMMSRRMGGGLSRADAFRRSVAACEGSVAVAAVASESPDRLLIALRGSGQGLYAGLADDAFIVASEPYGLVEETAIYVRMDGEALADPGDPGSRRGQIIELDGVRAGSLDGLTRWSYDGGLLPLSESEIVTAEITTRDIDRGDYPHFFLKEISEAPISFRKTLRGRVVDAEPDLARSPDSAPGGGDARGGPRLRLGSDAVPEAVRAGLRDSRIRRVIAIGQGTAAVAGESLSEGLRSLLRGAGLTAALDVQAMAASELSAFHLRPHMSDTLVVAISQSGTTTDTNRTVDLARARGAGVIAIVNRRNSGLTDRADGVLYTSDGRDVEMSVASTKAFYSQVAAGWLLAMAIADEVAAGAGVEPDPADRRSLLRSLLDMPTALEAVLGSRRAIASAARRLAPRRRHWAVVGNGVNRVAAQEIRIKLSELCYKSIPCDITEDKKHIDLSSEPLVLVCAAGLPDSVADDVSKEVAIFRAHRGAPVVVADDAEAALPVAAAAAPPVDGEAPASAGTASAPGSAAAAPASATVDRDGCRRFDEACALLAVPEVDPRLSCLPVTMAGHLFGYEAALAIDSGAQPLRRARAAIEAAVEHADITGEQALRRARRALEQAASVFGDGLREGCYDGQLEASTAVRIATVLRYALEQAPFDLYELEMGRAGTPVAVIEDLLEALTAGIDELTRPVDAIRHQAKTVTVGISRSDDAFLRTRLVQAVLAAGAPRGGLSYASLRTLACIDPAVAEVRGHTRYRVDGLGPGAPDDATATAEVVGQGGLSRSLKSRTATSPKLTGTKHRVAMERQVLASWGRHDGRTLVFVPEVEAGATVGITLLHVSFRGSLPTAAAREVLHGYRNRYSRLRDAVTETESEFDEAPLGEIPPVELLAAPVGDLADCWRERRPSRSAGLAEHGIETAGTAGGRG